MDKKTQIKTLKQLGMLHYYGDDYPQDFAAAFNFFKDAAELGDAYSQCVVAFMYERGKGTDQNMDEAISWYKKAAEQGYETAIKNLEILKQNGHYDG